MAAYYNENDPLAAAWLRELITAGLIAHGEVDERSIAAVSAADVRGFVQCHFFAGIGGWSYALRLAGWSDDRSAWTGSCPCQPFSTAGNGDGENDFRDLWPAWFRLIRQCRPDVVFGEQVANAAGSGWFDRLCTDLETEQYAVGAAVLGAHSVGAYHRRQRLWFVADAGTGGRDPRRLSGSAETGRRQARRPVTGRGGLDDAANVGRERIWNQPTRPHAGSTDPDDGLADDDTRSLFRSSDGEPPHGLGVTRRDDATGRGTPGGLADADGDGARKQLGQLRRNEAEHEKRSAHGDHASFAHGEDSPWTDADWIACRDGHVRPVESGTFPLAYGISGRVVKLRGYGNAIVPQVAAAFVGAYLEVIEGQADDV